MAVQAAGFWSPTTLYHHHPHSTLGGARVKVGPAVIAAAPSSPVPTIVQIGGGKAPSWDEKPSADIYTSISGDRHGENDWVDLESDLYRWTKSLRPVQMDSWLGNRKRILVLNREDMISTADRNAWSNYFSRQGIKAVFANGQLGMGTMKLGRLAKSLAVDVNSKRRSKGLLPRPVRAGIVGYPNVGKSSLINRLLKRRLCPAAPRPGVTRELKWVRFGRELELLDSPGIIPMRISDQVAAIKLAICDDIGERSYNVADVAAILILMLARVPSVGSRALGDRYRIDADCFCGKTFIEKLALKLFNGDPNQAAFRVLTDFRKGKFGWIALEKPPQLSL
ncbi:hypothetical protein AAC387_Pa05g2942 [Persea americana]